MYNYKSSEFKNTIFRYLGTKTIKYKEYFLEAFNPRIPFNYESKKWQVKTSLQGKQTNL